MCSNIDRFGLHKFIDPSAINSRPYKAKLIITLIDDTKLIAVIDFDARSRDVFWSCRNNKLDVYDKWLAMMLYGKKAGDPPVSSNPDSNDNKLYTENPTLSLTEAHKIVTPRGTMRLTGHGGDSGGKFTSSTLNVMGKKYNGFSGPAASAGTNNSRLPIINLNGCAEMHNIITYVISCWSGLNADKSAKSVIMSYRDSVAESIGGGGGVIGYSDIVTTGLLINALKIIADYSAGSDVDLAMLRLCVKTAVFKELEKIKFYDNEGALNPDWVDAHSCQDINIVFTQDQIADITKMAIKDYREQSNIKDFSFVIRSASVEFDVSHLMYMNGNEVLITIPGT